MQELIAAEAPSRARRLIRKDDILVGLSGAATGTQVMVVFPVTAEQDGWVATTGFVVVRPKDGVPVEYLTSLLKSPFVLFQMRSRLVSPAMPTLSEEDFLNLYVPVTNSDTRCRTVEKLKPLKSIEADMRARREQLLALAEHILDAAKANIFDLLDDEKYQRLLARSSEALEHDQTMSETAL